MDDLQKHFVRADLLCVQYYLEKVGVSPHTPHIKMNIKRASCSTTVCPCMIVSAGFGADLYHVTCKFSITERLSVAETLVMQKKDGSQLDFGTK